MIAAVLTSLLLPPEWAGGSGLFTPVAIEKGGIRELEFEIKNGCAKRATFQVELGGGLRTIASLGSTDPRIRQQLALGGTIDVLPG
ncbi:MAG: hypothetical protein GY953_02475, partial [bacterium]|nr:hypothetical protein [bacterium]